MGRYVQVCELGGGGGGGGVDVCVCRVYKYMWMKRSVLVCVVHASFCVCVYMCVFICRSICMHIFECLCVCTLASVLSVSAAEQGQRPVCGHTLQGS